MAFLSLDPVQTEQRLARMREELGLFFGAFSCDDDETAVRVAVRVRQAILDGRVKGNTLYCTSARAAPGQPVVDNCGCLAGLACFEARQMGVLDDELGQWVESSGYTDYAEDEDDERDEEDALEGAAEALLDEVQADRDGVLGRIYDEALVARYGVHWRAGTLRSNEWLLLEEVIDEVTPGQTPDTTPALAELVRVLDAWIADHDAVSATSEVSS